MGYSKEELKLHNFKVGEVVKVDDVTSFLNGQKGVIVSIIKETYIEISLNKANVVLFYKRCKKFKKKK